MPPARHGSSMRGVRDVYMDARRERREIALSECRGVRGADTDGHCLARRPGPVGAQPGCRNSQSYRTETHQSQCVYISKWSNLINPIEKSPRRGVWLRTYIHNTTVSNLEFTFSRVIFISFLLKFLSDSKKHTWLLETQRSGDVGPQFLGNWQL